MHPVNDYLQNVLDRSRLRGMDTEKLEAHFGGRDEAIKALGIYRQVWEYWKRAGVPIGRQYEIQILTGGKLQAGPPPQRATRTAA